MTHGDVRSFGVNLLATGCRQYGGICVSLQAKPITWGWWYSFQMRIIYPGLLLSLAPGLYSQDLATSYSSRRPLPVTTAGSIKFANIYQLDGF